MFTLGWSLVAISYLARWVSPTTDDNFIFLAVVLVVFSKANVCIIFGCDGNPGNFSAVNGADHVLCVVIRILGRNFTFKVSWVSFWKTGSIKEFDNPLPRTTPTCSHTQCSNRNIWIQWALHEQSHSSTWNWWKFEVLVIWPVQFKCPWFSVSTKNPSLMLTLRRSLVTVP